MYNILQIVQYYLICQFYVPQLTTEQPTPRVHNLKFTVVAKGSRDGAVVRALASHQYVLGLIPRPGVTCGLSLLLVLVAALRVFSGFSGFPPSTKINTSKF